MKNIVIWSLKSSHENIVHRKKTFELLSFDFIVDTDCRVWLCKVSSSPDLSHSTKMRATLNSHVCKDMLKVMFDLKEEVKRYEERTKFVQKQQEMMSGQASFSPRFNGSNSAPQSPSKSIFGPSGNTFVNSLNSVFRSNEAISGYGSQPSHSDQDDIITNEELFKKFDTGAWECIYFNEDPVPPIPPMSFSSNIYCIGRSFKYN